MGNRVVRRLPVRRPPVLCVMASAGLVFFAFAGAGEWMALGAPDERLFHSALTALGSAIAGTLLGLALFPRTTRGEPCNHLIESSTDGIAFADRSFILRYANPALISSCRYHSESDLMGAPISRLFPIEEYQRISREYLTRLATYGTARFEALVQRADGEVFSADLSISQLPEGRFACVIRDLSAYKRTERALIESRSFLRKVIDSNPNLIFVKDRSGRFALVNQALATFYGAAVPDIEGKTDADFNPSSAEVKHFREDDLKVLNTGEELLINEETVTDANGHPHLLRTVKRPLPFGESGEMMLLGVATDITEEKLLREQLFQAQKMDALGQLAGGIAHDFNNLLTGIMGYVSLLKMVRPNDQEVLQVAGHVDTTAQKAAELTRKLLSFARKGRQQNSGVDIHAVIEETLTLLRRTIEENITIEVELAAPVSVMRGDPLQLQQALLNLVINARDAMTLHCGGRNGGTLTIRTALRTTHEPIAGIGGELAPGRVLSITVADTGCGIPSALRDKIFEPFFTTKAPERGTGMGLAMVYRIVKNHGGIIEIDSVPEQGTRFTLHLPFAHAPLARRIERETIVPRRGTGTILFVDDHYVVRDVAEKMLTNLGYTVVVVEKGDDAIDRYRRDPQSFDLVILDLMTPGISAKDCITRLKKINPLVRTLVVTGYSKEEIINEVLDSGVTALLHKPLQLEKLSSVIQELLALPNPQSKLGALN